MVMGSLVGGLVAIYIIDKVTGKRKKVYVKDEAEKQRLLARNKVLREKLAAKKKIPKKPARKPAKKKSK